MQPPCPLSSSTLRKSTPPLKSWDSPTLIYVAMRIVDLITVSNPCILKIRLAHVRSMMYNHIVDNGTQIDDCRGLNQADLAR
jgi:hypothetical protein